MKTKVNLKRLLVAAGLFFVFVVATKAENNENVKVYLLPQKKVLLLITNPEKQRITLNITDNITDMNLYTGNIVKNEKYRKVFDLSYLPEGTYKLSVEFDDKVYEKEVAIESNKSLLTNESVYFVPEFNKGEDNLSIRYLNPAKDPVTVSFLNESDHFFVDKLPENVGSFKRDYNLKNLNPGNYEVILTSGDKNYYHSFRVH